MQSGMIINLAKDLETRIEWFIEWKIQINEDKTTIILFSKRMKGETIGKVKIGNTTGQNKSNI